MRTAVELAYEEYNKILIELIISSIITLIYCIYSMYVIKNKL
jgi:hypothetical protein